MTKECRFTRAVTSKVLLPKESSRNHVDGHARYARYKVLKKTKVNPTHLIWDYLIKFMEKYQGNLSFGSLISTLLEKKGLMIPYLQTASRLDDDLVWPPPIKLIPSCPIRRTKRALCDDIKSRHNNRYLVTN